MRKQGKLDLVLVSAMLRSNLKISMNEDAPDFYFFKEVQESKFLARQRKSVVIERPMKHSISASITAGELTQEYYMSIQQRSIINRKLSSNIKGLRHKIKLSHMLLWLIYHYGNEEDKISIKFLINFIITAKIPFKSRTRAQIIDEIDSDVFVVDNVFVGIKDKGQYYIKYDITEIMCHNNLLLMRAGEIIKKYNIIGTQTITYQNKYYNVKKYMKEYADIMGLKCNNISNSKIDGGENLARINLLSFTRKSQSKKFNCKLKF